HSDYYKFLVNFRPPRCSSIFPYTTLFRSAFAEYVVAKEDRLAPKPQNLGFEQAAPIGVSGLTALQAVRDHAQVKDGQDVLVIGADRKSTRLNSSHVSISYAVFCLKKKKQK